MILPVHDRLRAHLTRLLITLYAIDEAGVAAAQAWLAHLGDPLAPFAQPLDALETEVARGRRERRAALPESERHRRSA